MQSLLFCYHEDRSKKCCSYMYLTHGLFLTWTQRFYYITNYKLQYLHDNRCLIQPNLLLPTNPSLLTWKTDFFVRGDEYQSPFVYGLQTTAPPFASLATLSHPTVQVTLFTQMTSATPVVLVWNNCCAKFCAKDPLVAVSVKLASTRVGSKDHLWSPSSSK